MRIADMVLAFPSIVLAMAIAAALGPGLKNALIAIVIVLWPEYARLMRAQVLAVKAQEYVTAAEALGVSRLRLLLIHILPNTQAPGRQQHSTSVQPLSSQQDSPLSALVLSLRRRNGVQ